MDRGAQPNTSILWIETSGKWAANNGNTQIFIASEDILTSAFIAANTPSHIANSAASYANASFLTANTPSHVANSAASYANGAFTQANSNYTSAVTKLNVTHSGASAFLIDQYSGNNPSIYVSGGETIAFNLNVSGHPFVIRESSGGANTSTGLTHVSTTGVVSTGASAQGYVTGVLYWKVPFDLVGSTYVYQCTIHGGMVGNIVIQQPASFVASNTALAFTAANTADAKAVDSGSYANSAFAVANNESGVNATQNTNITNAGTYANAAFSTANSAFAEADSAASYANSAFGVANSAGSYANSSFLRANTPTHVANSAASYANGAFTRANNSINANTGGTITGSLTIGTGVGGIIAGANVIYSNVFVANSGGYVQFADGSKQFTANTGAAYANSAFLAANTPSYTANSAASYANSAFATANNEAGVNATQNTNITNAGVYANSAFSHANVVFAFANTISGGAAIDNTARSLANSASLYANSAFAAANTDVTNINITTGTYGNSAYYPVITVSANGRINVATTQVVTDPSAIAFAIALG